MSRFRSWKSRADRAFAVFMPVLLCGASFLSGVATGAANQPQAPQVESGSRNADETPKNAAQTDENAPSAPNWLEEARWYEIHVPWFWNGGKDNDPPGVLSWADGWEQSESVSRGETPDAGKDAKSSRNQSFFGGDLQGVQQKLPYLKELGVNTLRIRSLNGPCAGCGEPAVDLRHVHPCLAVKKNPDAADASISATDWHLSESDRCLAAFLRDAHRQGFRVVLDADFLSFSPQFHAFRDYLSRGKQSPFASWFDDPDSAPNPRVTRRGTEYEHAHFRAHDGQLSPDVRGFLEKLTDRWMDMDGDGEAIDGIDGWWVTGWQSVPDSFFSEWTRRIRTARPEVAVLVERSLDDSRRYPANAVVDGSVYPAIGSAVERFFRPDNQGYSAKAFLSDLEMIIARQQSESAFRAPLPLRARNGERLMTVFSSIKLPVGEQRAAPAPVDASTAPSATSPNKSAPAADVETARWLSAIVVQHCLPGAPLTLFGDEVGMFDQSKEQGRNSASPSLNTPMWWRDIPGAAEKVPRMQSIGQSLIQWLHLRRNMHAPLRRGEFRPILADEERKLLAFARTLPGDEVIAVVNFGDAKQQVTLKEGKPGQIVGILIPQWKQAGPGKPGAADAPSPNAIVPLRMNGSRQQVNPQNEIRFWIGPQSTRLVLIQDQPPA